MSRRVYSWEDESLMQVVISPVPPQRDEAGAYATHASLSEAQERIAGRQGWVIVDRVQRSKDTATARLFDDLTRMAVQNVPPGQCAEMDANFPTFLKTAADIIHRHGRAPGRRTDAEDTHMAYVLAQVAVRTAQYAFSRRLDLGTAAARLVEP